MYKILNAITVLVALLLVTTQAQAARPALILLPVQGSNINNIDKENYRLALQSSLSQQYLVFSGAEVEKRLEKSSVKTCDASECLQEVAISFQGELIGRLVVTKSADGYLLGLEIKNIFDDNIIDSRNIPCENCNNFAVIRELNQLSFSAPNSSRKLAVTPLQADKVTPKLETALKLGLPVTTLPGISQSDRKPKVLDRTPSVEKPKKAADTELKLTINEEFLPTHEETSEQGLLEIAAVKKPDNTQPKSLRQLVEEEDESTSVWTYVLGAVLVGALISSGGDDDDSSASTSTNSSASTSTDPGEIVVTW
jgi:hypothetical protein